MTTDHDPARRIDTITRTATRIRAHLPDLHHHAWETPIGDTEPVATSKTDHTPRIGSPAALRLYKTLCNDLERIEALLAGHERAIRRHFMVAATTEPTRGSLIPAAEHARLLAKQRARAAAGEYVPVRLVDQPPHPRRGRP